MLIINKYIYIYLLFIFVLFINCNNSQSFTEEIDYIQKQTIIHQYAINDFIKNPFKNKTIKKHNSSKLKEEIFSVFSKPIKIDIKEAINIHNNVKDVIYIYIYAGLTFRIYHVINDNKQILGLITIKNNNYKLKYGVFIGMSMGKVRNIFGKPKEKTRTYYKYFANDDSANELVLSFTKNQLTEIKVLYQ